MVLGLYAACIARGLSPDYFWRMPPREAWLYLVAATPEIFAKNDKSDQWDRLEKLLEDDEDDAPQS